MSDNTHAAATRLGMNHSDYLHFLSVGMKWCTSCKDWHPRDEFGIDSTRGDGLRSQCHRSRRVIPKTDLERFVRKHSPSDDRGCIEWTGAMYPTGYGSFWFDGRVQPAHRVSWMMFRGSIPDGLYVLHRCDNRKCVNPEHLFLGTHQDNMDDMLAKGRKAFLPGESSPRSKLTEADVVVIRSLRGHVSQRILAKRFGVSKTAIRLAQIGRNWKCVREFPEVPQ